MKRATYALILVMVMALLGGFSWHLLAGLMGSGTSSVTVTVTAVPGFIYIYTLGITDVSDYVDVNGVFTEEVTGQSADGLLQLTIPEGTVGLTEGGEPLSQISIIPVEYPPPPPEDCNVIGLVYDLGPVGATFDPPITVTFTYDESLIPEGVAEENLVIVMWYAASEQWYAASGQWIPLEGCSIDPETNAISGLVSRFTEFTILACIPPPLAVGGEVYPINKAGVLAPWLGLMLILAIGGGILALRRSRAY